MAQQLAGAASELFLLLDDTEISVSVALHADSDARREPMLRIISVRAWTACEIAENVSRFRQLAEARWPTSDGIGKRSG